ncbi:DJ-1/PfpI family protein [Planctobacterium marinum]|uniref:AraC family transcriptional regulator n=1 Tax=Planctobacterium marinum TaxID=1631968 RepID=A0AA48HUN4_9ALTE|nr:AraC family transcriptional regulator [Planctobacterium marinum]
MQRKKLAILIFDQVEVLDFTGPFEVFSVADELHQFSLLEVCTVACSDKPITAVNGLKVVADYNFEDCPEDIDILVLPGGDGTKQHYNNPTYQSWIEEKYHKAEQVLTVCSGTRFLASLGLLDKKRFCTHQEVYPALAKLVPAGLPQQHLRYVTEGKLTSAGGISAGIDAAFDVLQCLAGAQVANKTAQYMEYHRNDADSGHEYQRHPVTPVKHFSLF